MSFLSFLGKLFGNKSEKDLKEISDDYLKSVIPNLCLTIPIFVANTVKHTHLVVVSIAWII